jgi:hypothetical protein
MAVFCDAITQSGKRCGRPALTGKSHCLMHDPASAEARRAASRKGGVSRSHRARASKLLPSAMTADELSGRLSQLFTQVVAGAVEPRVGAAAATIARVLMEARESASVERLEQEVAELRAQLHQRMSA